MPININIKNGVVRLTGTRTDQEGNMLPYNVSVTRNFLVGEVQQSGVEMHTCRPLEEDGRTLPVLGIFTKSGTLTFPINLDEGEKVVNLLGEVWQDALAGEEGTWQSDKNPSKTPTNPYVGKQVKVIKHGHHGETTTLRGLCIRMSINDSIGTLAIQTGPSKVRNIFLYLNDSDTIELDDGDTIELDEEALKRLPSELAKDMNNKELVAAVRDGDEGFHIYLNEMCNRLARELRLRLSARHGTPSES